MNKIYKYTFLLIALLTVVPALAQTDPMVTETDNLWMKKTVKDNENGTYTLNLQTYVRGTGQITTEVAPSDIVLAMDLSSSMNSNKVTITNEEKKERLSKGTSLTTGNIYKVVINGKEYYLKCIKRNNRDRWYYRYDSTEPTAYNSGQQFSDNEYYQSDGAYTVKEGDEIYLYTPGGEKQVTRLEALKIAAKGFVETVYANNPSTGFHNIAMVGFSSTTGTVKYNDGSMQAVNSTNKETMKSWIDDLKYNQGTRTDLGMQAAYNILNSLREDGRAKTVVLFSDGCPSTSNGTEFNSSYAKAAVNIAYAIKQELNKEINYKVTIPNQNSDNSFTGTETTFQYGLGATIYSVAILSSETSGANLENSSITYDIRRMLHYISSNYNFDIEGTDYFFGADYKDAVCQIEGKTGDTGSEAAHDYYQLSTGANLSVIFKEIAGEVTGNANIKIDANTAVVLDVISNKFRLPAGTKAEDIKLYTCDVVEDNTTEEVIWKSGSHDGEEWVEWKPWETSGSITDYIHINSGVTGIETDNNYLEVTGYDFATNYVGPIKNEAGTSVVSWHGQKLIIEFVIETDPANEGGLTMATNDPTSGLYIKKTSGDTTTYEMASDGGEPAQYKQPTVNLPYIKIIKKGLKVGESALFRVTKVTEANSNVAVTDGTAYTADVIITRATESQNDDNAPYAILKLVYTGDYKVEELPWAWAYTHEGPQWGHLSTVDATSDTQFLTFTFINTTNSEAPEHAESFVPNNMSVSRRVGDPKTGSTGGGVHDGDEDGNEEEEGHM